LINGRGKKLALHFECGMEVPAEFDTRMQIEWDWQTWLEEGIPHELTLKFWDSQNTFIPREIMPRARRKGLPVWICNRNGLFNNPRTVEIAGRVVAEAAAAGFAGLNFYENADFMRLNSQGVPLPTHGAAGFVPRAREVAQGG
jgi:hypothetical protein